MTLRINGVLYQRHVVRKNKIYWHCPQYRTLGYVERSWDYTLYERINANKIYSFCRCRARACSLNSECLEDIRVEIMEKDHNHGSLSQSRIRIEMKPKWKFISRAILQWSAWESFFPLNFHNHSDIMSLIGNGFTSTTWKKKEKKSKMLFPVTWLLSDRY